MEMRSTRRLGLGTDIEVRLQRLSVTREGISTFILRSTGWYQKDLGQGKSLF